MATQTVPGAESAPIPIPCPTAAAPTNGTKAPAAMLPVLGAILAEIAFLLGSARTALHAVAEDEPTHMVLAAIAQAGWMADHGATLAGAGTTLGGAEAWFLPAKARALLGAMPVGTKGCAVADLQLPPSTEGKPVADKLDAVDSLSSKLAQARALSASIYGESMAEFDRHSSDVRGGILWLLQSLLDDACKLMGSLEVSHV